MSQTCLIVILEKRALNMFRNVFRVGTRVFSTMAIVFLVLSGYPGYASGVDQNDSVFADHSGVDASILSALQWRFVGPYRGGRVVAVAGAVDDHLTFYFGAAHGGVWKTTDAGLNWRNVSDDYIDFPSIGALDVSLSDPEVIFAGTGEGLPRQYISHGVRR